jgi:hypothetical protein
MESNKRCDLIWISLGQMHQEDQRPVIQFLTPEGVKNSEITEKCHFRKVIIV